MTTRFRTMDQVQAFLEGTEDVEFSVPGRAERLGFICKSLGQLGYLRLRKKERGLTIRYLCRITGYSRQQMTRLIAQWRKTGVVEDRRRAPAQALRHALHGSGCGVAGGFGCAARDVVGAGHQEAV